MLIHFKPPASLVDQFLTVVGIWDKSRNSDLGFHWKTPTLLMSRDWKQTKRTVSKLHGNFFAFYSRESKEIRLKIKRANGR